MGARNDLLFGLIALQSGAVETDRLAEVLTQWKADKSVPLADRLVDGGYLTVDQKNQVERLVAGELKSHGGDAEATLAATIDGRFLDTMREVNAPAGSAKADSAETIGLPPNYEFLGSTSPFEGESATRYTRTHLYAKGGMGQVWVARDKSLRRQIALKELRPDQKHNSILLSRFLYEARITAQLEHPGIVPVYELGGGAIPFYTIC